MLTLLVKLMLNKDMSIITHDTLLIPKREMCFVYMEMEVLTCTGVRHPYLYWVLDTQPLGYK